MYWMLLPLKRYADFSGRSRRKEYWMFVLGYSLVLLALALVFGLLGAFSTNLDTLEAGSMNGVALAGLGIVGLLGLAILVPSVAVQIRRLHDRDLSGWWLLILYVLSAVPFVGFIASIAMLVLAVLPGTPGPNRFGPDPKDPYGKDVDVFA